MTIDYAFLDYALFNNTLRNILIALFVLVFSYILLKIFRMYVIKKLKQLAAKTETNWDDFFIDIFDDLDPVFYLSISLYLPLRYLVLPTWFDKVVLVLLLFIVVYYITKFLSKLIDFWTNNNVKGNVDVGAISIVKVFIKIFIWAIAFIWFLDNLGYNVSTLIAGLGIGGIAIAFALQNILADIFSSISIFVDKPFKIGDYVVVGTDRGTIKKIGIKSTRIQTLQGEELVIPNKVLSESKISNFKMMQRRRVEIRLGLVYDTPVSKIRKAKEIIKEIVSKEEKVTLDRIHFSEFANHELVIEMILFIETSDYKYYMDEREKINLAIKERFEKEKIEFAYPTQTIYLKK